MIRRSRIIGFSLVSLCFAFSSFAGTIELEATGTVTSSGFASVPVGTTLTAFLFYDSTAAAEFTGVNSANYAAPEAEVFTFGGSTLTAPPNPNPGGWDIVVGLDAGAGGLWSIPAGDSGIGWVESSPIAQGAILNDPGYDSTGFAAMELAFAAPGSDGVLTSLALPSVFPTLPGGWTEGSFIYLPIAGAGANFAGTFDSVVEVSPEPETSLLSALALTALLSGCARISRRCRRESERLSDGHP